MKKTCLVVGIIGVVGMAGLAFLALLITGVFYLTSGPVTAADNFFEAISQGDIVASEEFLSEDFKKGTSSDELEQFLRQSKLNDFKSVSWSSRSIENDTGNLSGTVTCNSGETIPLTMTFVNKNGSWLIQGIELAESGVAFNQVATKTVPSEDEAAKLVDRAIADFGDSIRKKDYSGFWATTDESFRNDVPLKRFTEIFSGFIDVGSDFSWVKGVAPVFDVAPTMNAENGRLELRGHYLADPYVGFEFDFVDRADGWKIVAINVVVRPVADVNSKASGN